MQSTQHLNNMVVHDTVPMSDDLFDNTDTDDDEDGGTAPFLTNDNEGAAAWLERDKNGNVYVSVSLPLGLSVNLFPRGDRQRDYLNQLYEAAANGGDL